MQDITLTKWSDFLTDFSEQVYARAKGLDCEGDILEEFQYKRLMDIKDSICDILYLIKAIEDPTTFNHTEDARIKKLKDESKSWKDAYEHMADNYSSSQIRLMASNDEVLQLQGAVKELKSIIKESMTNA